MTAGKTAITKRAGKATPVQDPVAKEETLAASAAVTKREKENRRKKGTRPPRQPVQEATGLKEKDTKRKRRKERDRQNPPVAVRSITKAKISERNIYDAAQRGDIKTIKRELDRGTHPDAFRLPRAWKRSMRSQHFCVNMQHTDSSRARAETIADILGTFDGAPVLVFAGSEENVSICQLCF